MEKKAMVPISIIVSLALILTLPMNYLMTPTFADSDGDLPVVRNLAIAIDSEDNLHIVWEDGRDEEVFIYKHPTWFGHVAMESKIYYAKFDSDGQRLVNDTSISSGGGESASIEIDSNDNLWVTYWMNGSFALKLTKEGVVMLEKELHHRTEGAVAIAMGSDDGIYLSWDECERGQCYRHFMTLDTDGNVLTGITNVSLVTPISGFQVVLDGNGEYVYLGHEGVTDSNNYIHQITGSASYDLFYTKISNVGEIEINRTKIALSGKWDASPRVSIDPFDNIHVVAKTWGYIGHFELDSSGNLLRTKTDIRAGKAGGEQMKPDVDSDSLGRVFIVWHVEEVIHEEPGTGDQDFSYSSYCIRIEIDGTVPDSPWLIASSKTDQIQDGGEVLLIAFYLLIVTGTIILVVLLWSGRKGSGDPDHRVKE